MTRRGSGSCPSPLQTRWSGRAPAPGSRSRTPAGPRAARSAPRRARRVTVTSENHASSRSPHCRREQRVVLGPQHPGRLRDPLPGRRRTLGEAGGHGPRSGAVPADRGGERPGLGVPLDQPVEVRLGQRGRPGRTSGSRSAADRPGSRRRSPSRSRSESSRRWNGWYQNSRCASGSSTRSPAPGSGGASTSARTRSAPPAPPSARSGCRCRSPPARRPPARARPSARPRCGPGPRRCSRCPGRPRACRTPRSRAGPAPRPPSRRPAAARARGSRSASPGQPCSSTTGGPEPERS